MNKLIVISALFLSSMVHAKSTAISCEGTGGRSSGNDLVVEAQLDLVVTAKKDQALSLDAKGVIKTVWDWEEVESELNDENAYVGHYDTKGLKQNLKYRPAKHKDFVQFPNFDAKTTTGRESGMWGSFLLEKNYLDKKEFAAKYIFQAGDHMGGTIDFTCSKN